MQPNYDAIVLADQRLRDVAVRTPVLKNPVLDKRLGADVFVKAEPLQRTGSFKFRGAYNRLVQLSAEQKKRGVVAFSSGNHAQGVACAAQLLGIQATIIMPQDAPQLKLDNTKAFGAQVITYNRACEDREEIAKQIAGQSGAVLVPAYDDVDIIAGQGTVGLELVQHVCGVGKKLDIVFICLGGGGLSAGMSLAIHEAFPNAEIKGVEPEGYDDGKRSLDAGAIQELKAYPATLCDALQTPFLGQLNFAILKRHMNEVVTVSDAEIAAAMRFAFQNLKIVVEPGGAAALAAVLRSGEALKGKSVGLVLSGGNIDRQTYSEILMG